MSIIQEALQKAQDRMASGVDSAQDVIPPATSRNNAGTETQACFSKTDPAPLQKRHARMPGRTLALSVALILVACGAVFYAFKSPVTFKPAADHQEAIVRKLPATPHLAQETNITTPSSMLAQVFQSPQKNFAALAEKSKDFVLDGIMYVEDAPQAIINNSIVGEGDIVNGATVSSISEREVVLRKDQSEIVLRLK